jgi:hypothetical protein
MKKLIYLLLVFSILTLSMPLSAKERKGADLIIQKTDGTQVRGELIAVKQNSLVLMERDSGADVTVDIKDVNIIKIVKKSKTLAWGGIGLVSGAVIGVLGGYLSGDDYTIGATRFAHTWPGPPLSYTADEKALIFGIACGIIGGALGGIGGAFAGADKTIQIEGKSDSEIQEILEKLRKQARIRDSQ